MQLRASLGFVALVFCLAAGTAMAQDTVAPNENLVPEGLPPLPRALADRAAPYMEFRAANLLDWHPTQREMLITTRFAEVPQLHQVALPGGARTQLTFYREPVTQAQYRPRPSAESGKGGSAAGLVFARDVGGSEFYQLFWRDSATGRATLITDGHSRNGMGPFSNDGRWLTYRSTRRNGRDFDLYVIDPADPSTDRRLLEVSGSWSAVDWAPDDRRLLAVEFISAAQSRLHLVDATTGATTSLTPPGDEPVSYGGAAFARDGKGIYLTTDRESEFWRLCYLDLATRRLSVLTPNIPWDVSSFALSDDGRRLALVVNEAGSEVLRLMDLRDRSLQPPVPLPRGTVSGLKFHANSRELGFNLSSARSPADAYSLDVTTGRVERWTRSETGGLDATQFSEPELVRWPSFDRREITGYLYRPPARFTGPRPVIVDIHGGPESQFQPRFLGRGNFFLNELGVALLYPNVRGSAGFGKTFLQLDNGAKREDSVRDIGALLDWLGKQPGLDAGRVMVQGGSYGGYMTLASLTHYNDRLRAGVDIVGISNFVTLLERTEAYRRDLRRTEYGDERDPQMRELLLRISPLTNAAKITRPLFIIAGKNDPRVNYREGEQMAAAIRRNGGPVWYLLANDEGHGFAKKPNVDFMFLAMIRFVEDHLLK